MERRCHYEVLGLDRGCTADEIKSAYLKLALQRHPDKLVPTGVSQADANAQFQELGHAYEVLSDPKERAWYDSHRSQILFADPSSANSVPDSVIPNLFSFFSTTVFSGYSDSGKGFYKVYSDVFTKIYSNELSHTDLRYEVGGWRGRRSEVVGRSWRLGSACGRWVQLFSLWELFGKNGKNERSAAPSSSHVLGQFNFFFKMVMWRVDAVSRNGQRVATVSKKFDFSDTPRGVSDAVSGRVGTYRRVGERPMLRHSMVRGVRAS
ncbi:hypothetical protein ACLB2K_049845 [Fragaria x ananassa]